MALAAFLEDELKVLFFIGYGLSPIWVAFLVIVLGYMTMSDQQAGFLLWLVAPAIPSAAITLAIAWKTCALHDANRSDAQRSKKAAAIFFFAANAILIGVVVEWWVKRQLNNHTVAKESAEVIRYVEDHNGIRMAAGEKPRASISTTSISADDDMPTKYELSVEGDAKIFAIVYVERSLTKTRFRLSCTTLRKLVDRGKFSGPCEQNN